MHANLYCNKILESIIFSKGVMAPFRIAYDFKLSSYSVIPVWTCNISDNMNQCIMYGSGRLLG